MNYFITRYLDICLAFLSNTDSVLLVWMCQAAFFHSCYASYAIQGKFSKQCQFFLEITKFAFLKPFQDSLLTFILKISFIKDKTRLAYRSRKIYDLFHILFHIFISYII